MAKAPFLHTERLRLVPFTRTHLSDTYLGWLNDPETMRYSEQRHTSHDRQSVRSFLDRYAKGPGLLWAIESHTNAPRHIGNITANIDPHNRLADIGILIGARDLCGQGYGTEAWRTVLEYLADRKDVDKVTGGCLETNSAMLRIMEKVGMHDDGYRPKHYIFEGSRVNIVYRAKTFASQ